MNPGIDCDIAIVGAGVAGLAAGLNLRNAGKVVICLEATGRVGGRILTFHDPLSPLPIELGAEFVHGLPPETWSLIRQGCLTAFEHAPDALHIRQGNVVKNVDEVSLHGKSTPKKDQTFDSYLRHSHVSRASKSWTSIHIEGFNAARKERISVASLKLDQQAADEIDGDRAFRILNGYDSIPLLLHRSINSSVQLNSIVECVQWRPGSVEVLYRNAITSEPATLRCRQLIVTVPLGVLQSTAIQFDPEPGRILQDAGALEFGQVYRVTFRFRTAFWEDDREVQRAGFLISQDKQFFSWWTSNPIIAPLLTGWCAGSAADQFRNCDSGQITHAALESLGRILNRKIPGPEAVYFHDWHADPFFRGAYSYVPVDGMAAREALSKPVKNTLFFAGEATESKGHASTVHGAIASGIKAADLVLGSKISSPRRSKSPKSGSK